MRIYKSTYRGRDGQVCESAKFYCELRTADGRVLRLPGFGSQPLTESLGRNVQRLSRVAAPLEPQGISQKPASRDDLYAVRVAKGSCNAV